jgi:hypothetical protein
VSVVPQRRRHTGKMGEIGCQEVVEEENGGNIKKVSELVSSPWFLCYFVWWFSFSHFEGRPLSCSISLCQEIRQLVEKVERLDN